MDLSDYSGSNFRRATDPDLKAGPKKLRIIKVEIGKFEKPDIYFDDGSILGCNKTNMKELIRAFGSDSSDLIDREVELYVGEIPYQGVFKPAVLVRAIDDSPAPTPSSASMPIPSKRSKGGGRGGGGRGGSGDMDDQIPF